MILISERLPEIGKPVLTFDGERFAIERYVDRFFCDGEEIEGEWWIDGYDGDEEDAVGLRDGTAIAWMPLPSTPNESSKLDSYIDLDLLIGKITDEYKYSSGDAHLMAKKILDIVYDAPIVETKGNSQCGHVGQCRNDTECNPVDEFICSNCGLILRDWQEVRIDEDDGDESNYEFEFSFCPKCGHMIAKDE